MDNKICVAFIRRPQGIKGEVRVSVLLDNPKDITKLIALQIEGEDLFRKIERVFSVSDGYAIKLEGVTIEKANSIKNKKLFALREEVDKLKSDKDIYIEDIMEKLVKLDDGELLGKIVDVQNFGANDIIYIESEKYKNLCFANIGGIIINVDDEYVVLNKDEFNKVKVCD